MKKTTLKLIMLIAGVIIYDFLFWENYWGLNALLFTVLLFGYLIFLDPSSLKNKKTLITAAGTLLAGALVVTHNSVTSIVALLASFIVMTGFYFQPQLRSAAGAIPTGFLNFFFAPFASLREWAQLGSVPKKANLLWDVVRLSAIPLFVCYIFYLIYQEANPVFDKLSTDFVNQIADAFIDFFKNFSWLRLFFILLGILIVTGILVNGNIKEFVLWENKRQDELELSPFAPSPETVKLVSLQDEYRVGLILMALINVLLLIVNLIDINWLWFGFEFKEGMNLSHIVHEGTNLLIISILLSIAIMLFFFRGALNYHNGKWLRYLAYGWIVQNTVMAVSVAIRNYNYISYLGLTYKRIGVFIFLVLTLFGLITLALKIRNKKSFYFLVRTNSWAAYCVMLSISFFNWDLMIVNHNIHHPFNGRIDFNFLLSLSDKTLHLIGENHEILEWDNGKNAFASAEELSFYKIYFDQRVSDFLERKQNESWVSWNYPEQVTYDYFLQNKPQQNE